MQLRPTAIVRHSEVLVRGDHSAGQSDGEMDFRLRIESLQGFELMTS